MDKEHFDQLVKAVRQMNGHIAGKVVRGVSAQDFMISAYCSPFTDQRSRRFARSPFAARFSTALDK